MSKPKYGDCIYCGGPVSERTERFVYELHGQMFIFEGVRLGRCEQCGERFLTPQIAEKLETLASRGGTRVSTVAVPVHKAS